jgi:hypothetical protein
LKAAFVFLAPDVDAAKHRFTVVTPAVELKAVGAVRFDGHSGQGGKGG